MSVYSLTALGMVNALGTTREEIAARLWGGPADRLVMHRLRTTGAMIPVGQVQEPLPDLRDALKRYQCRNHALALAAFRQIEAEVASLRKLVGKDRIGVVMGSSTSGIDASETAFFHWRTSGKLPPDYHFETQHEMGALAEFIARLADVDGPAYTVSTACSSSAKVFASARSLLDLGLCDAVIVGGADTLCHLTLNGFEALAALPRKISNPLSRNREGLNIGEGAALFVLSREPGPIRLLGVGESSDAHHISAPDPEGRGAESAMRNALKDAGLEPEAIHYINLHGTGTPHNDSMESAAIHRIFGQVPVSSTKPLTGHCLGAAGAIEAGFCWLALEHAGRGTVPLPPHHWDGVVDEKMPALNVVPANTTLQSDGPVHLLSNSFAFGGSNCAVILGANLPAEKTVKTAAAIPDGHTLQIRGWTGWAPGLHDQDAWRRWLLEPHPLTDDASVPPCAEIPPMLRRRCGRLVRMVLESAFGVCRTSGTDPAGVHHVHCSRFGEINVLRELSESLFRGEPLSPTLFSNSVHQTPAAYFDLAARNVLTSRTISAGRDGLVCAMIEVWGLLQKHPQTPVLLTFADEPPPEPFGIGGSFFPIPFAAALLCESAPGSGGQTVHGRQSASPDGSKTSTGNESLFDFLRWLAGNEPRHETVSSSGIWTWQK